MLKAILILNDAIENGTMGDGVRESLKEAKATLEAAGDPIGFLSQMEARMLRDPAYSRNRESQVSLWHPSHPPSRATVPVYLAAPLAQSAEQDRIDAERWRYAMKYWLNPIDLKSLDGLIEKDKGASK